MMIPIPQPRPDRPIDHRSNQVPLEPGGADSTNLVRPGIYNWVEKVYEAFKQTFPTGANERALLGIREMSRTAGKTQAQDTYGQGSRTADRGKKKSVGSDSTTTFNDILFMVWTEQDASKGTKAKIYGCTIDPSIDYDYHETTGSPYLLEGLAYHAFPDAHKGHRTALHVFSAKHGSVVLAREATKKSRIFTDVASALVEPSSVLKTPTGPKRWEFVGTEKNDTIHVHWSKDYNPEKPTTNWSAGCTVLRYAKGSKTYTGFESLVNSATNSQRIPYLVVSSAYVQRPDAWAASAAKNKDLLKDAASTLIARGLVRAPAPLRGYLPSIMTFHFAQQVLKLADDLDKVTVASTGGNVDGLDESLANVGDIMHDHADSVPKSLKDRFLSWNDSRKSGRPLPNPDLAEGLDGLSVSLRSSLQRACFETVAPHTQGPQ